MGRHPTTRHIPGRYEPTWVYRCFDAEGELLYVGQTRAPVSRMSQWRSLSSNPVPTRRGAWFGRVRRITWRQYPNWWAATEAEVRAIRTERPLFNRQHNVAQTESAA